MSLQASLLLDSLVGIDGRHPLTMPVLVDHGNDVESRSGGLGEDCGLDDCSGREVAAVVTSDDPIHRLGILPHEPVVRSFGVDAMFAIAHMVDCSCRPLVEVESEEDAGDGDEAEKRTGGHHDQRGSGTRPGDGPSDPEECTALEVVGLWHRSRERELASEPGHETPPFEKPEQRGRRGDRRGHQEKDVGFVESQHGVNGVVLVEACAREQPTEQGSEDEADDIQPHNEPPVSTRRTNVVAMAVAMNVAVTARLAGDRWAVPQSPWPDVQPPASAAP